MTRKAISWIWPVAGCLFWLLLLTGAILRIRDYGWSDYTAELSIIPVCMIAFTLVCGFAMPSVRRALIPGVAASVIAVLAAIYWLGLWGMGV